MVAVGPAPVARARGAGLRRASRAAAPHRTPEDGTEAAIATVSGVPHDRGPPDIALPESDRERAGPDAVKGIRVVHFREIVRRCGFAFEGHRISFRRGNRAGGSDSDSAGRIGATPVGARAVRPVGPARVTTGGRRAASTRRSPAFPLCRQDICVRCAVG
ncbi:hypothetical protein GCM10010341_10110 [Streptomyces noursei]|nr:hypothetical protein GCM10010341_10110 [Streptomyces noursei]